MKIEKSIVLRGLLDGIVFLFEGVKITMIIFFVIYELTSLKEKAEKLKWTSLISLLDVFNTFHKNSKFHKQKNR